MHSRQPAPSRIYQAPEAKANKLIRRAKHRQVFCSASHATCLDSTPRPYLHSLVTPYPLPQTPLAALPASTFAFWEPLPGQALKHCNRSLASTLTKPCPASSIPMPSITLSSRYPTFLSARSSPFRPHAYAMLTVYVKDAQDPFSSCCAMLELVKHLWRT